MQMPHLDYIWAVLTFFIPTTDYTLVYGIAGGGREGGQNLAWANSVTLLWRKGTAGDILQGQFKITESMPACKLVKARLAACGARKFCFA